MPRDRSDFKYVWDMLEAAKVVTALTTTKTLAEYEADIALRYAVERGVEIIGEAARGVSDEFREKHHNIPWSAIIATRHIIAHEYGDLQHDKLWRIATSHIPSLMAQLEAIIATNPPPTSN